MKTTPRTSALNSTFKPLLVWLCLMATAASVAYGQTLVSGNISGTWSPSGNPYVVTDNCTVPSGTNLTLQPGVVFMIGANLSVTNNGSIQALGTPTQRITIQAPTSSIYWSNIVVNYYKGVTNRFKYCDFQNARTALRVMANDVNITMPVEIMNCTFSNCTDTAIYGKSWGIVACDQSTAPTTLSLVLKNCFFASLSNGCIFNIEGSSYGGCIYGGLSYAAGDVRVVGNIFTGISGTAITLNTSGSAIETRTIE